MADICRKIELGRHGSIPEVKAEWTPPAIYYRTSSLVVNAEICAPEGLLDEVWESVQGCALTALGVATLAGLATGPTTAIPTFQSAFKACVLAKLGDLAKGIKSAISTEQKANEDWHK